MIRISTRSISTFFVTGLIALSLPLAVFFTLRFFMARMITRDNAEMVFEQFQSKLDTGAMIRDGLMAAEVADRAYRDRMNQTPLDGWGKPVRIRASVQGNQCVLTVLSAGPDGAFGTKDDVPLQRSFDLSKAKTGTTQP